MFFCFIKLLESLQKPITHKYGKKQDCEEEGNHKHSFVLVTLFADEIFYIIKSKKRCEHFFRYLESQNILKKLKKDFLMIYM